MTKRILVVDDEEDIRMVVKDVLENSGFSVYTVPGGKEALNVLKKEKFDLVLIDFFMPEMSGRELLKKIREDQNLKQTKCAMITVASFSDHGTDKLEKLDVDDYIKKPFDNDDLIKRVNKILSK